MIDQLHNEVELIVVYSRRKNLNDIWVIGRRRHTRFLLQLRAVIDFLPEIFPQQLQRHETIQQCIPRLVNRAHPANAERFLQNEIVEGTLNPHFFPTRRAGNAEEGLGRARLDRRTAGGTFLRSSIVSCHRSDCNIDRLRSNAMPVALSDIP
jgi:hypothetical protein